MELEQRLVRAYVRNHPRDTAAWLESLPASDAAEVVDVLTDDAARGLFRWLSTHSTARTLDELPARRAAALLEAARFEDAVAVLRLARGLRRDEVVAGLTPGAAKLLTRQLRYPEGTAGALMDPRVFSTVQTVTAGEAAERLRDSAQHALYYVYVVTEDHRLCGALTLPQVFGAPRDRQLGSICVRELEMIAPTAASESVLGHPGWRRLHALPVVEEDGRLVGVLRYEAMRSLEQQFVERASQDQGLRTAAAMGEVFGLGARALVQWAAAAVQPTRGGRS